MALVLKNRELYLNNELLGFISNNVFNNNCTKAFEPKNYEIINKLLNIRSSELLEDLEIHTLINDIIYEIYKNNNISYIKLCFIHELDNWELPFTPKKYCDLLLDSDLDFIEDVYIEDGNMFIQTLEKEIDKDSLIKESFDYIKFNIDNLKKQILIENEISSEITFSPEHLTAGSSILQYFGKLLQEKYPNEKVSVSIKQEGFKVSMKIETPDGKKEEVEEYLNRYGLVISNQITPQEFTSNPIQVLELETKLKTAEMEIGFQKKLIALQDKTYDENLVSLKDEVKYLREELSTLRKSNDENIKMFLSSLLTKDKLIKKLTKAIDNKNQEETKQLLVELKEKDSKGYTSLKEHIDNAIIGGVSNAPSWVQFTVEVISRIG